MTLRRPDGALCARVLCAAFLASFVVSKLRFGIARGAVYSPEVQIFVAVFEALLAISLVAVRHWSVPIAATCFAAGVLVQAVRLVYVSRSSEVAPSCGCLGGSAPLTHGQHVVLAGVLCGLSVLTMVLDTLAGTGRSGRPSVGAPIVAGTVALLAIMGWCGSVLLERLL